VTDRDARARDVRRALADLAHFDSVVVAVSRAVFLAAHDDLVITARRALAALAAIDALDAVGTHDTIEARDARAALSIAAGTRAARDIAGAADIAFAEARARAKPGGAS